MHAHIHGEVTSPMHIQYIHTNEHLRFLKCKFNLGMLTWAYSLSYLEVDIGRSAPVRAHLKAK